ncbi:ras GTPase-activating-like protein IQGAP3 isoform X2 [Gouania willdenowi]|uniref:ras GTPase-activating-like protein IQGAP3 isoform X1 n=1 Tax=Gouania willdenowi TaxID=441366 RepID=UPI0010556EDC|nr:ras GTPase-activating-like protein IQGAP3 isoform X1 [Gouania willdenowi]XP_028297791.1 ras GTPase-activating-like protein IQGAP3 isoform X2 [Gouania willdenowi]
MTMLGFPLIFHPETTDVYDKKNMPRVIYCLHALSLYLYRLGLAPQIQDLYGKVQFTDEQITHTEAELDKYGIQMPAFNQIGGILTNELSAEQAAVSHALAQVDQAVEAEDEDALLCALLLPCLCLTDVCEDNRCFYLHQLMEQSRGGAQVLCSADLQRGVALGNQEAKRVTGMRSALHALNAALRDDDPDVTLRCLMTSDLELMEVVAGAHRFYHQELQLLQDASQQGELQHDQLFVAMEMLTAVTHINQALGVGLLLQFQSSLVSPLAGLSDVNPALMDRYFKHLIGERKQRGGAWLTWNQLQEGINRINQWAEEDLQQLLWVSSVNEAVIGGDVQCLCDALSSVIGHMVPDNGSRYMRFLIREKNHRAQVSGDPAAELWLADIQEAVKRANQERQSAIKLSLSLAAVNQAVKENNVSQTLRVLKLPDLGLKRVYSQCAKRYQEELLQLRGSVDNHSPWVAVRLHDDSLFYFNLNKLEGEWEEPQNFIHNSVFLQRQQIQEVINSVTNAFQRGQLWKGNESLIVALQAHCRGYLIRQQLETRKCYVIRHTPAAVTIQANWRRFVQQRMYRRRLQFLCMNWKSVVKIQSLVRMFLQRRSYRARLDFFRRNVCAVVVIQSFFRAHRVREQYRILVHSATPPLPLLRKFVHLLDHGDADITAEAELCRLRQEVSRSIRFNRQLEAELNLMDLKIGLLVRNRATLHEVESQCKNLTKKNKEQLSDMMDKKRNKGLKALSRSCRERLSNYQHLFYLLQTRPGYLAQLVCVMPQSRSSSFMEMLVFSVFNYGSAPREAFLLLTLFTHALGHEIRLKVERPLDVLTGSPPVIQMLVNFYRGVNGQSALQEVLGPAIQEVLDNRSITINIDPVQVYRKWINHTESRTGRKSSLPYDVCPEEALSHPEVHKRVQGSISELKRLTEKVLRSITSNLSLLPYGLRYTAKTLRDALRNKFSDASEEEIYKVVGNLVYYRYMNPVLVAPDAFGLLKASQCLQTEQRLLLGTIARTLQLAAANQLYSENAAHARDMNQFITLTHHTFRRFLVLVCDVPDPEERFGVDEFSEDIIINNPTIYISVSELLRTHQLLLEHQEVLSPDPTDPLRLLLNELGAIPSLHELIDPSSESSSSEISLKLTNKFNNITNDDAESLLLRTKQLILDVIGCQSGETLHAVLRNKPTPDQEAKHDWLMRRRQKVQRSRSLVADGNLSLQEKKKKIRKSLRQLETLGVLGTSGPSEEHFLSSEEHILSLIAKDIRQQKVRRQRRGAELNKLHQTLSSLQNKSRYYSEQVDYYLNYINTCYDQLTSSKRTNQKRKLPARSYSAACLQEKGVLLEIEDLPAAQFKNVVFEITPAEEKGSFTVSARFLGVRMEEFDLKYQELLHLQYEGVAVMKMFDKAKVNVNLLIFLLNKKFFNK